MFSVVAAWMSAAQTAIQTALPDAYVTIGPLAGNTDDIGGLDLVIIGQDDALDEPLTFSFEGSYRDTGANATTDGEVRVPITLYSAASSTDLDIPSRIAAASSLHTAVRGALLPSPALSALGVSGLMWANETDVVAHVIPTVVGPVVRLSLTYTLATLV